MRNLTLDEKISMKGLFAVKGIVEIPRLSMKDTLFWWRICFGKIITKWNNERRRGDKWSKHIRTTRYMT